MILFMAATAFQPVSAVADVTTSNGKSYSVETCFTDPTHLRTRFIYPDRTATFVIDGEAATTAENQNAPQPASDGERSFAFGHNFHAIHYNFDRLLSDRRRAGAGWTGALPYGGQATSVVGKEGRAGGYRFDLPGTTPIELRYSDWREGGTPFRLELMHAGVTYDYKFTKVLFAGAELA